MSTEKMGKEELLKLAALAAGYEIARVFQDGRHAVDIGGRIREDWDPLENDSDALHLAARAGIAVDPGRPRAVAFESGSFVALAEATHDATSDDVTAAARLVIVHAAVRKYLRRIKEQSHGIMS